MERQAVKEWAEFMRPDAPAHHVAVPDLPFPNPTRLFHVDVMENLAENLRMRGHQKALVNAWRYDCTDSFTATEQAKAVAGAGHAKAYSADNALAIAQLIETARTTKNNSAGLNPDTVAHLDELSQQLYRTHANNISAPIVTVQIGDSAASEVGHGTKDKKWVDVILKDLLGKRPPNEGDPVGGALSCGQATGYSTDTFDDLRNGNPRHDDRRRQFPLTSDQVDAFNTAVDHFVTSKQLLMFVHGPPGTGKTILADRIMAAANRIGIGSKFSALSGAAASINGGSTIHYLTNLGIVLPKPNRRVTEQQVKEMRTRGGRYGLLIIDEVSMLHAKLFACVESRFTQADLLKMGARSNRDVQTDVLFGGMHVLLMGDCLQLPPPTNFVKAMYVDCVDETAGSQRYSNDPQLLAGIQIFRRFKKVELTTQNRASTDSDHRRNIANLRKGKTPVDEKLLRSVRLLTAADMVEPRWQFAPILVTTNLERTIINRHQAVRFARARGTYVLTWIDRIANATVDIDDADEESIDPTARRYFVIGAPAFVGKNINSAATGIVNGSSGTLDSVSFGHDAGPCLPDHWTAGEMIEIDAPYSVNVRLQNGTIVPLTAELKNREIGDTMVARRRHPVQLGFAVTYHKVQGQTLDCVILGLHQRKSRQLLSLCFEMLYVAWTRVRRAEDMRVLYFNNDDKGGSDMPKGLRHLLKLERPLRFDGWMQAYDSHGQWNAATLERQAAADRRRAIRVLRSTKPLLKYTVKKMHPLCLALGLVPDKAPGKNYARRKQYRMALFPTWVTLRKSRKVPDNLVVKSAVVDPDPQQQGSPHGSIKTRIRKRPPKCRRLFDASQPDNRTVRVRTRPPTRRRLREVLTHSAKTVSPALSDWLHRKPKLTSTKPITPAKLPRCAKKVSTVLSDNLPEGHKLTSTQPLTPAIPTTQNMFETPSDPVIPSPLPCTVFPLSMPLKDVECAMKRMRNVHVVDNVVMCMPFGEPSIMRSIPSESIRDVCEIKQDIRSVCVCGFQCVTETDYCGGAVVKTSY